MKTEIFEEEAYKEYPILRSDNTANDAGWEGFIKGAEFEYWRARKAFCKISCGENCPLKTNDIDSSGDCPKLEKFVKELEE